MSALGRSEYKALSDVERDAAAGELTLNLMILEDQDYAASLDDHVVESGWLGGSPPQRSAK